jgi:hypothetical protein
VIRFTAEDVEQKNGSQISQINTDLDTDFQDFQDAERAKNPGNPANPCPLLKSVFICEICDPISL